MIFLSALKLACEARPAGHPLSSWRARPGANIGFLGFSLPGKPPGCDAPPRDGVGGDAVLPIGE